MRIAVILAAEETMLVDPLRNDPSLDVVLDTVQWSEETVARVVQLKPEVLVTSEFVPSDDAADVQRGMPNPAVWRYLQRIRSSTTSRVVVLLDGQEHPEGDAVYRLLADVGITNLLRWTSTESAVTTEDVLFHIHNPRPLSDVLALCGDAPAPSPDPLPAPPREEPRVAVAPAQSEPQTRRPVHAAVRRLTESVARRTAASHKPAEIRPQESPEVTMRRPVAHDLTPRVIPARGELIAVCNVGVTSAATFVAVNLAALAARAGAATALIDGGVDPGVWDSLGLHEQVAATDGVFALKTASSGGDSLRDQMFTRLRGYEHLWVAGRFSVQNLADLPDNSLLRVRDELRRITELVVVDIGGRIESDFARDALRISDRVLCVVSPDVHRLRRAKDALESMQADYSTAGWELVLSPWSDRLGNAQDYAEVLGLPLAAAIPAATELALEAQAQGVPAVEMPGAQAAAVKGTMSGLLPRHLRANQRNRGILGRLLGIEKEDLTV